MKGLFSTSDGAITKSSTAGDGVADFEIAKVKKQLKTRKKTKDGTDGIDATDEREEEDRWRDAREFANWDE